MSPSQPTRVPPPPSHPSPLSSCHRSPCTVAVAISSVQLSPYTTNLFAFYIASYRHLLYPQTSILLFSHEQPILLSTHSMSLPLLLVLGIRNMLNQAITTERTIHPSMGTTEFLEYQLTNPNNAEVTIAIRPDSDDIRSAVPLLLLSRLYLTRLSLSQ